MLRARVRPLQVGAPRAFSVSTLLPRSRNRDGIKDRDSCSRFSGHVLLRHIKLMSVRVNRQAVNLLFDGHISECAYLASGILLINGNKPAETRDVDAAQSRIVCDHVAALGHWEG